MFMSFLKNATDDLIERMSMKYLRQIIKTKIPFIMSEKGKASLFTAFLAFESLFAFINGYFQHL